MYINVSIDFLYKKITSLIAYFATVAKYNLARKNLEPPEYFAQVATLYKRQRESHLVLDISYSKLCMIDAFCTGKIDGFHDAEHCK